MAATYEQRKALGDYGERLAVRELQSQGFVVLDRNFRCAQGEIDIVARDGRALVGCEVKTRRGGRFGSPVEAITPDKAARVFRVLHEWAAQHGVELTDRARVDVVAVTVGGPSGGSHVTHFAGVS